MKKIDITSLVSGEEQALLHYSGLFKFKNEKPLDLYRLFSEDLLYNILNQGDFTKKKTETEIEDITWCAFWSFQ